MRLKKSANKFLPFLEMWKVNINTYFLYVYVSIDWHEIEKRKYKIEKGLNELYYFENQVLLVKMLTKLILLPIKKKIKRGECLIIFYLSL